MKYEIIGGSLPAVEIFLDADESIKCEKGSMSWMSDNMGMQTDSGGFGAFLAKAMTNERIFHNVYTAIGKPGMIALASSFPGNIVAVDVRPGKDVICQKSAFLASTENVDISVYFQKKLSSGLFGGEGFIMQRLSGWGTAFLEIDGSAIEKDLGPGERIVADTGYLAMMDGTCTADIVRIKGAKNVILGGEGLFNTVITGPGHVVLQTMPIAHVANSILPYLPLRNSDN